MNFDNLICVFILFYENIKTENLCFSRCWTINFLCLKIINVVQISVPLIIVLHNESISNNFEARKFLITRYNWSFSFRILLYPHYFLLVSMKIEDFIQVHYVNNNLAKQISSIPFHLTSLIVRATWMKTNSTKWRIRKLFPRGLW